MRDFGLAVFLALCLAGGPVVAQPYSCPDLPPYGGQSTSLAGDVEVSLLGRVLSGLGLSVDVKTATEEILSRYPDSKGLFEKVFSYAETCRVIMANDNLDQEEKLRRLTDLLNSSFGTSIPTVSNYERGSTGHPLTATEAAATASELARLLFKAETTTEEIIERLSVPFCGETVLLTDSDIHDAIELARGSTDTNVGQSYVVARDVKTLGEVNFKTVFAPIEHGRELMDGLEKCGSIFSPRDFLVTVDIALPEIGRNGSVLFVIARDTGRTKGTFSR